MSGGNSNNISSSNVGLRSKDAAVLRQARGRMQQRSAGGGSGTGGTGSGSVSRSGGGTGTITPASAATTGLTSAGGSGGFGGEPPYSSSAMSSVSAASSRNYQHQQQQHPPSSRQQQHSVTWSTASGNSTTTTATNTIGPTTTTTARTTGGAMNYSGGGYPSSSTTTTSAAAAAPAAATRTTTSLEDRTLQATEFMTTVLASARKQPPPPSFSATSHELSPRRIIPGVPKRQLTSDFSLDQTTAATAFDSNITLSRDNLQQQQAQPPYLDRTSTMGTTSSSGGATVSHANVTSRVKLGAKIMTTTTTTNRGLEIDTSTNASASSFLEANQSSLPEPFHGEYDDDDDDDEDAVNATTGTIAIAARQEPTVTDAACLPLGGTFRLGLHYYAGFVAVESLPHQHHHPSDAGGVENKLSNDQHDRDDDDDLACKVTTRGLGLHVVAGDHGDASPFGPQHDDAVGFAIVPVHCVSLHVLCFGDVIGLQASSSSASSDHSKIAGKERYLGIQALSLTMMTTSSGVAARGSNAGSASASSNLVFAVGLYRSLLHKKANQWQVLDASDLNQPIPVGPGAQQYPKQQNDGNTNTNSTILPPKPAKPVRSGDAIMLRNVVCGGILSISAHDDGLIVYTDSYHQTTTSHGAAAATTHEKPGEDSSSCSSLLTRLERHNVFHPTSREVFHFLLPTIPPTAPLWVMGGGPLDRRPFLNGTYLLDPHRHDKLMGHCHHHDSNDNDNDNDFRFNNSLFLDHSGRMQECGNELLQTPQGQEIVLVDELIGSFLGLEGTYIRAVDSSLSCYPSIKSNMADLEFQLVDTPRVQFDMGLRSLVGELLALSTNFCRVNTFTGNRLPGYEYGSVMQALCKSLDEILQEHCVYIAKLEIQFRQKGMTMRRLQVLVRPNLHSMSVLERVTRVVSNEKGGSMINALRRLQVQVYQGDGIADAILYKLLESASIPYMSMLQEWLDHGILSDPHEEFVIRCNNHEGNTDWDGKYSIAAEHLLEGFFSTHLTGDRVLATGKYWNAVCTCRNRNSERVANTHGGHFVLSYHANGTKISSYIHTMYFKASRELVHVLMERFNLVGALRLMKRYFLLDQGDFFVNFMDAAEEELSTQLTNLSFGRIQHWLNTSIQITEHQGEEGIVMTSSSSKNTGSSQEHQLPRHLSPNELRCSFARETLMVHLDRLHGSSGVIARNSPMTPKRSAYGGSSEDGPTGLDVFMMGFTTIPFPVSLVLSQKAVSNYQLLFRLLFYTKQVERRLVSAWMDHQAMKELPSLQLPALRRALLLRQRMLHCVQNLIYYMMFEVIEPNWLEMEAGIASPAAQKDQTVDDILAVHSKFLERTVEACLLTNSDLVCALTRLLRTCLLFSNQMELFMKRIKIHDDRQQVAIEKQTLIQRSLNDRGGGTRPATNLDRKALRGSMQRDRLARQERIQEQTRRVEREVAQPAYSSMVARYDDIFSEELVDFLRLVSRSNESSHSQRVNLCIRLDYNGFLSESRSVT